MTHRIFSRRAGFWVVAFAFLSVSAFSTLPSPLYGLYRQRDGFSSFTVTLIYAAYAIGIVVSLFLVGHVSDWFGRRRILVPAIVLCALSAVVFLLWPSLPGLLVGRILNGLALGAVTPAATAYLGELYAPDRPRRAQDVALTAYIGGFGLGALLAGLLAQYLPDPLTLPYVVLLVALVLGAAGVALCPETRPPLTPRPRYRPQRVAVPRPTRGRYVAAALGVFMAFAVAGLLAGLTGTFLVAVLHRTSTALAGATIFVNYALAISAQLATGAWPPQRGLRWGVPLLLTGLALVVTAVWLPTPSLALFLVGGGVTGAGIGAIARAMLGVVVAIAPPNSRAEALAGYFLAGYIGLSVPVLGVGIALQYASPRAALLGFAIAVAVGTLAATPMLLRGGQPGRASGGRATGASRTERRVRAAQPTGRSSAS